MALAGLFLVAAGTAAPAAAQQFGAEVMHQYERGTDGGWGFGLMQASDGNLYGVTSDSYAGTPGSVFRQRPDGLFTVLHWFTGGLDGGFPSGVPVQGPDGHLYGMTSGGGQYRNGTVYRLTLSGQFTVLHSFAGQPDAGRPSGSLIVGSDGAFYGVTAAGGTWNAGTAFRMTAEGSVSIFHHFNDEFAVAGQPLFPGLGLVEHAGAFYGMALQYFWATVYRLSRDGSTVIPLYSIDLSDGDYGYVPPNGLPTKASDGSLYHTSKNGCKGTKGTFRRIAPDGAVSLIREFESCATSPRADLVEARDGSFLVPGGRGILRLTRTGEITTVLDSPSGLSSFPRTPLVQAVDGTLYGGTDSEIYRLTAAVGPRLRASAHGPIHLTWTSIFGASSYTVKRTSAGGQELILARVSGTSFVDTTAIPGQRYVYSISSTTPYGDSEFGQAATVIVNRPAPHDVDGDGQSDVIVYRPNGDGWGFGGGDWLLTHSNGLPDDVVNWGGTDGDVAAPGDYDGDGVMDVTIFRPSNGTWWVRGLETVTWGEPGDVPVPGDYDGNGTTDIAVYRRSTGTWWVRGQVGLVWGEPNDIPVPADYNGDGVTDIAVYRPFTGTWYIRGIATVRYGIAGDIPVPADYDGDGQADIAVFRRTNGTWYIKDQVAAQWGTATDVPVTLDRDGDGKVELGVYRRLRGDWWFKNLATGAEQLVTLGGRAGDVPIGRGIAQLQRLFARAASDFDYDGRDDVMVFRPSAGRWFMRHSDRQSDEEIPWFNTVVTAGERRIPLTGDYNGDGAFDIVDFRPASGQWWVRNGCCAFGAQWGIPGDTVVPGDYNGDGVTDFAMFRPSTNVWYIMLAGNLRVVAYEFGSPSDTPVPADYNGDGITDIAFYRAGEWIIRGGATVRFGESGDIPVPADYDGDGRADFAVYRPATGTWFVRDQLAIRWGQPGDVPLPLDRDGDGRAELIVFRPSNGTWYFTNPATGASEGMVWGVAGDIPVGGALPATASLATNAIASAEALRGDEQAHVAEAAAPMLESPVASHVVPETGRITLAASPRRRSASDDFDGDGRADVMIYRPRTGDWWMRKSNESAHVRLFWGGTPGDVPAPGDYDGDGLMDPTVFRQFTGNWHIRGVGSITWGVAGDVPVPDDYNGDGVTDVAVYRPSTGTWHIRGIGVIAWGERGDLPVPADYNGDGLAEIAVYRPTTGVWFIRGLANVTYGVLADIPAPADYDGDGAADIAVFRPSTGTWLVKDQFVTVWGQQGDIPVPLDRDGDGRVELGVYRRGTGVWYFKDQLRGTSGSIGWGEPGDVPIGRGRFPWHSAFGRFDRDFDRDGRDDLVRFQPYSGWWLIRHSDGSGDERVVWGPFGALTDLPVPGDYNGDGLTDVALFEQKTATWYVRGVGNIQWGLKGDVPVPGDYNGDGITDIAVYRPSTGIWLIRGVGQIFHGGSGTLPVPADYNGDGVTDVAVTGFGNSYYVHAAFWNIPAFESWGSKMLSIPWGQGGGEAVVSPLDVDADGRADFVQYNWDYGLWKLPDHRELAWGTPRPAEFARPGDSFWWPDTPVALDLDGDGRTDLGFFRPETGTWRFRNLASGATQFVQWGVQFSFEIPLGRSLLELVVLP